MLAGSKSKTNVRIIVGLVLLIVGRASMNTEGGALPGGLATPNLSNGQRDCSQRKDQQRRWLGRHHR